MGATVTQRIGMVKQPRGGYVPLKRFDVEHLEGSPIPNAEENLSAGTVGTAVDNLARLLSKPVSWLDGHPLDKVTPEVAFDIALAGARKRSPVDLEIASSYASQVIGLDEASIINACKLMAYDAYFRAGQAAFVDPESLVPNQDTIENIRTMVTRYCEYFEANGPVISLGPTFEGAYTDTISKGDGDLLTKDAIWDIKTSAKAPRSRDTLQIYVYYLMGKRSINPEFRSITRMGIFNPRLNKAYSLSAELIDEAVKDAVEYEVIGYLPAVERADENSQSQEAPVVQRDDG